MILLLMVAAVTVADDPILVLGPALARHMHVSASRPGGSSPRSAAAAYWLAAPIRHERSLRTAATALAC